MAQIVKSKQKLQSWHSELSHMHLILVEPSDSLNVGAVARAMGNLGYDNLCIVAAPKLNLEKALVTARWAAPIIERAHQTENLEDALSNMQEVVGFSAKTGKNRIKHIDLQEWLEHLNQNPRTNTALVFGPEDTGLRLEHTEQCRYLIRIPSNPSNPAFNLAQAALIVMYEVSKTIKIQQEAEPIKELGTWGDFKNLDLLIELSLRKAGFYNKGTSPTIPRLVKNLFRRTNPSEREMQILLGIFGRISKML